MNEQAARVIEDDRYAYEDRPICPYCGYVETDAWDIDLGPGTEGDGETDCNSCGETMLISRHCSITYSTRKKT